MIVALALALCAHVANPGGVALAQPSADPPADPAPPANVPDHPDTDESGSTAAPAAPAPEAAPAARPARRPPAPRMFTAADDRAERERLRAARATRRRGRRDPAEPEVLELAGMPDAYYYRPARSGRQRVLVYLHSRGANPRDACRRFYPVARRFGWLVCPVGPGDRGGNRRVWNNNAALARRYSMAALARLQALFPRRVRATDNVVMGFSEGAFVAMQTGLMEPAVFSRWVIFAAHDGYIGMNGELYPAARRALRRVYLITGAHDEIVEHTRRADAFMRRQRLGRVRMQILRGANHELPPDFDRTVRAALLWVTGNGR